jgi:hypothetical protein
MWAEKGRGAIEDWARAVAAGLLVWSVGENSQALFDAGAETLCLAGIGAIAWMGVTAERTWLKKVALVAGVLAALLLGRGIVILYGWGLTALLAVVMGGAAAMIWMVVRGVHRRSVLGRAALCVIGCMLVYVVAVTGRISTDWMGGLWFFALVAGLAWVGARAKGVGIGAAAVAGIVCLLVLRTIYFGGLRLKEADPAVTMLRTNYRMAQAAIPAGATVFVMVRDPARLDFSRNRLFTADYLIQFVSPPPHVPVEGDVRAFREYWRGLRIRYMMLAPADLVEGGGIGPARLRENFAEVVHSRRKLFASPELVVVDLESGR